MFHQPPLQRPATERSALPSWRKLESPQQQNKTKSPPRISPRQAGAEAAAGVRGAAAVALRHVSPPPRRLKRALGSAAPPQTLLRPRAWRFPHDGAALLSGGSGRHFTHLPTFCARSEMPFEFLRSSYRIRSIQKTRRVQPLQIAGTFTGATDSAIPSEQLYMSGPPTPEIPIQGRNAGPSSLGRVADFRRIWSAAPRHFSGFAPKRPNFSPTHPGRGVRHGSKRRN